MGFGYDLVRVAGSWLDLVGVAWFWLDLARLGGGKLEVLARFGLWG